MRKLLQKLAVIEIASGCVSHVGWGSQVYEIGHGRGMRHMHTHRALCPALAVAICPAAPSLLPIPTQTSSGTTTPHVCSGG